MQPILGIELDDAGHRKWDRKERDEFVNKVFAVAGLPLIRIAVQPKYDLDALAKQLTPYLGDAPDQSNTPTAPSPPQTS